MDIGQIECKLIDFPESDSKQLTFDEKFAHSLAGSIKAERLFNPILVRPHPTEVDRFVIVQGRHRLYATWNVLKLDCIWCNIVKDMDEVTADIASMSENLYKKPQSVFQYLKRIKKSDTYFAATHPESVGRRAGGNARAAKQAAMKNQQEEEKTESFTNIIAGATGKSKPTVERDLKIARAFDDEQLDMFEHKGVAQQDMTRIAKIKDGEKKAEVINLVAKGTEPAEAISMVLGADAAKIDKNLDEKVLAQRHRNKYDRQAKLSDDDWFISNCGERAKSFNNPIHFARAAILYHQTASLRLAFRANVTKPIKESLNVDSKGPFNYLIIAIISVADPNDWPLCTKCNSTGEGGSDECLECNGRGFVLSLQSDF